MAKKKHPRLPPGSGNASGPAGSNAERRGAAQAVVREQQRRAKRRALVLQAGIGALVVAGVIGVTLVVLSQRDPGGTTPPDGLTTQGGVRFGAADASVAIEVIEDFQCPACRTFEEASGSLLAQYRESADVAVEYRPIGFLDRASSTEYSSRAMNASACVLDGSGKDAWIAFHDDLYENQPAEGGEGLPDDTLVAMAAGAGATGDAVRSCIEDRRFDGWVQKTTQTVLDSGISSTPTVLVNGEELDAVDPENIEAAVAAASGS